MRRPNLTSLPRSGAGAQLHVFMWEGGRKVIIVNFQQAQLSFDETDDDYFYLMLKFFMSVTFLHLFYSKLFLYFNI